MTFKKKDDFSFLIKYDDDEYLDQSTPPASAAAATTSRSPFPAGVATGHTAQTALFGFKPALALGPRRGPVHSAC